MPVSEHDPVSNEVLRLLTAQPFLDPLTMGRITGMKAGPLIQCLAADLLAYREVARALVAAWDAPFRDAYEPPCDTEYAEMDRVRALVALTPKETTDACE